MSARKDFAALPLEDGGANNSSVDPEVGHPAAAVVDNCIVEEVKPSRGFTSLPMIENSSVAGNTVEIDDALDAASSTTGTDAEAEESNGVTVVDNRSTEQRVSICLSSVIYILAPLTLFAEYIYYNTMDYFFVSSDRGCPSLCCIQSL